MSSSILPDHLSWSQNDLVRISVVIHDLQRPVLIHILNNNNIIRLLNSTIDAENVADVTRKKERREDTINDKHKQNDKQIKNNKKSRLSLPVQYSKWLTPRGSPGGPGERARWRHVCTFAGRTQLFQLAQF